MQKIVLHPQARKEMFDAAAHYDDCHYGLGTEFLDELEKIFSLVKTHPAIGPILRNPFRRVLMFRFPYGIIYREKEDVLYVVSLMHLKRKPGYWLDRAKDVNP